MMGSNLASASLQEAGKYVCMFTALCWFALSGLGENNLCTNVRKTKEMVVDFRKLKDPLHLLYIGGAAMEVVSSYNELTWSANTLHLVKKAHQHLYFLKKLQRAGLGASVLRSFYRCVVENILCTCITVWHGSWTAPERTVLCTEDCGEQPFLHLGPLHSTMQEEGAPHHEGLHPSC
ncbi:hypothetical protein CCH79_00000570, partial [Gambusia affinis]